MRLLYRARTELAAELTATLQHAALLGCSTLTLLAPTAEHSSMSSAAARRRRLLQS